MKKHNYKKIIAAIICFATVSMSGVLANPGDNNDPLITLSYTEDVIIPQMKSYVDSQIAIINTKVDNLNINDTASQNPSAVGGTVYNIVNVSAGQTIVGGKSCQMILRMGQGTIVASQKGGIADVTTGTDLANGTSAPSNHLLIVPLDDGRGIKMKTDGIIMISGSYSVNQ